MEVILENTIKNSSTKQATNGNRVRRKTKSVMFQTEKNDYYNPKEWK